jgi:hypothetical protein
MPSNPFRHQEQTLRAVVVFLVTLLVNWCILLIQEVVQSPKAFSKHLNPELTTVNLSAVTYPNPTSDYVTLKISDSALDNLSYKLFDVTGKAMSNGNITNRDTQITMRQLAIGIYILKVNRHNQELKTFKIIKK